MGSGARKFGISRGLHNPFLMTRLFLAFNTHADARQWYGAIPAYAHPAAFSCASRISSRGLAVSALKRVWRRADIWRGTGREGGRRLERVEARKGRASRRVLDLCKRRAETDIEIRASSNSRNCSVRDVDPGEKRNRTRARARKL
jgi:hypothetical protein